jgi:hypothetical protein
MKTDSDYQLRLNLNDRSDPEDVIDLLFLESFVDGTLRRARAVQLPRVRPRATMLPAGVRPDRSVTTSRLRSVLAHGAGWVLRARRWSSDGSGDIWVLARSNALAERVLADATRDVAEPVSIDPHQVPVGFWHFSVHGPSRSQRTVAVAPWTEIRRNYTARTAAAADQLMAWHGSDPCGGRLLLLHGAPGTGKTSMLRALCVAWRRWCQVDCVLDPERLFADPAYLLEVTLVEEDGDAPCGPDQRTAARWRLLVLEDCDELIRPGAKSVSGQALARLLNVTDGFAGQGARLLVAITTNEPVASLHPAVTRPGRCLATIEVGRLSPAEARSWLGRDTDFSDKGTTLAELYACNRETDVIEVSPVTPRVGQYL